MEAEISLTEEENGLVFIDLDIVPTPNNKKFVRDITEDWTVHGVQSTKYGHFVITNMTKASDGPYPSYKVKAVASFIHKMQTTTFDGLYTGSRTAVDFFYILSQQSGLTFQLTADRPAYGWEKFGEGVHTIKEFNRAIKHYDYVYLPVNETSIELRDRIGRDVNFIIKNAMNADDVKMEIDRSEVYTYIEGYADFEQDSDFYETAQLYSDYKSPLYDIIGEKKAETYSNGAIKHKATLDKYLMDIVDNSVKFTISAKFRKIRNYPFAVPMLGDRIRVQDESIDLNTKAKIVKLVTHYDPYGEPYDYDIEFGNLNIGQRNKQTINTVSRQLDDILNGRDPIKLTALDGYLKSAITDFKSAQTELVIGEYVDGVLGIFLVDKADPNRAVGLTSKGIVLTTNGFAGGIDENLAIDPTAVNASMIRAGTLHLEDILGIVGRDGLITMTGDEFRAVDANDPDKFISIKPGMLEIGKGALTVHRDDGGHPSIIAGRNTVGERLQGMNPPFMHPQVYVSGQRYVNDSTERRTVDAYYFDQFYRDVKVLFAFRNNGTEAYTVEYGIQGFGNNTGHVTEFDTIVVPASSTEYRVTDFHLSVPQVDAHQFYIQFACKTADRSALMSIAYVKNLDMSKYDSL
ncbi:hypothetical protein SN16_11305 [Salinicoccus roseus]|uniref:Phage tail protein n=1 Tax=Salinicoccus roseus TaxID=45670 RepID=A0A0C2HKG6_9STAP|nr:phage tail protein [Salinicoccus roseus]KIH70076.1 hypothetical protein SN16_11305 [Salinicoccus roseus]MDB0581391.1 phage tail protein [Salinicoccus roseus]